MKKIQKRYTSKNKQRGMTLIELMIGIGVSLSIVAITIGLATATRKDQSTQEFQTQILQVAGQLQSLGKGGSFNGVTTKVLVDSGKVPKEWVGGTVADPTIKHALSGTITVAAANLVGGIDNSATMTVTSVERSACVNLITNSQASFAAIGKAAAEDIKAFGASNLTPAAVVAACTPDSGETVQLILSVM